MYRPIVDDPTPSTRLTDSERNDAVDTLTGHVASGRLALDEFDVRASRVYSATTRADLDTIFDDLPRSESSPPPTTEPSRAPITRELLTWASVGVLCLTIWAVTSIVTGTFLYPWPVWVIGPWGAMLALQRVTGMPLGCTSGHSSRSAGPGNPWTRSEARIPAGR